MLKIHKGSGIDICLKKICKWPMRTGKDVHHLPSENVHQHNGILFDNRKN